jgi:hypothetical protein
VSDISIMNDNYRYYWAVPHEVEERIQQGYERVEDVNPMVLFSGRPPYTLLKCQHAKLKKLQT